MDWIRQHLLTLLLVIASWVFTIGYVRAETEGRITRLEADVSEVQSMIYQLKTVTVKLEVVVDRLERIVEER